MLLLSALSFSYVMATAGRAAPQAANRVPVGSDLDIVTPLLGAGVDPAYPNGGGSLMPEGYDLGDACRVQDIQRYINVRGGFPPYFYRVIPLLDDTNLLNGSAPPLPLVNALGRLDVTTPAEQDFFGNGLRFSVLVSDLMGNQKLGNFRISLKPCLDFRFAINSLPNAVQLQSYSAYLSTYGTDGDSNYSVVPGSVMVGTTVVPRLEDTGLVLAPDGAIFGRPIAAADIKFTAHATTSASSNAAKNRAGTKEDQNFKISVAANTIVTTELTALKCSLRGSRTENGTSTLSYSGALDMKAETPTSLAGTTAIVRVGRNTFSAMLDDKGKASGMVDFGGAVGESGRPGSTFSLAITPKSSKVTLKISGVSLATGLNLPALIEGTQYSPLIVGIEAGSVRSSEVLQMETVLKNGGGYKMDYAVGKRGFSVAGGFQIITVAGTDSKVIDSDPATPDSDVGTRWRVTFLAIPTQLAADTLPAPVAGEKTPLFPLPTASAKVLALTSAEVRIGELFAQTVTLALPKPKSVTPEFKIKGNVPGLRSLRLNSKSFKHNLDTNALAELTTMIPQATGRREPSVFPLGLNFTGLSGEVGRVIVPDRAHWKQR